MPCPSRKDLWDARPGLGGQDRSHGGRMGRRAEPPRLDSVYAIGLQCTYNDDTSMQHAGRFAAERELGATVFWMTSSASSQTTMAFFLEQFQIRRDGGRRGIVEVLL